MPTLGSFPSPVEATFCCVKDDLHQEKVLLWWHVFAIFSITDRLVKSGTDKLGTYK